MPDKTPTAAQEAIAQADAYLSNAVLPTYSELVAALRDAHRLNTEALPKFNWGASALDGNAIRLLNEAPGSVQRVLRRLDRTLAGDFGG